ncbi:hypothetical protein [Mucilaginibacter kameinonensis]|uniref:hypothetical protein n=1 Tax=Mucilaginibacter kameinonensis TaxID=452286 RepID=UPI000EF75EEA|nr:hypothetical protein [Mucilaginibacter kameinonensis]
MNFTLEKIERLSGEQASVYSVTLEGDDGSLFEKFLEEYTNDYKEEIKDLVTSLQKIGHKTGARADFFKVGEGRMKDNIDALFDEPDRNLRLYCIRFGRDCIILGGGGPKSTRSWQEDPNLSNQMEILMAIADRIHKRFKERDLRWAPNMRDIIGELDFKDNDDDEN